MSFLFFLIVSYVILVVFSKKRIEQSRTYTVKVGRHFFYKFYFTFDTRGKEIDANGSINSASIDRDRVMPKKEPLRERARLFLSSRHGL